MKMIEMLVDMIDDELDVAKEYICCAIKHKEDNPSLASAMYSLSVDEMRHVDVLHDQCEDVISMYRREGKETPEGMTAIWDYVHGKHKERASRIKLLQAQFKT